MMKMYRQWREQRRVYKELDSLSAKDLRDIGISPGEIYSISVRAGREKV